MSEGDEGEAAWWVVEVLLMRTQTPMCSMMSCNGIAVVIGESQWKATVGIPGSSEGRRFRGLKKALKWIVRVDCRITGTRQRHTGTHLEQRIDR
jgi:hypothetical protein